MTSLALIRALFTLAATTTDQNHHNLAQVMGYNDRFTSKLKFNKIEWDFSGLMSRRGKPVSSKPKIQ